MPPYYNRSQRQSKLCSPTDFQFNNQLRARPWSWRTSLWLTPIVGGIYIYLSPSPQLHLPSVFSSPTLIPCQEDGDDDGQFINENMIGSPAEPRQSILSRVLCFFQDHIREPFLTARRFIHLFYLFVPLMITMPMLFVGKPEKRLQGDRWGLMQAAGPTFIKLAQWAATRADLFPSLLCDRLGAMHSQGSPHSFTYTKTVIERVFEKPFDQVFEEFDENPIGTGAIAQVYKATLKRDLLPPSYLGPKRQSKSAAGSLAPVILQDPPPSVPTASVAIKVLHPRVSKMIGRDLAIMSFFASVITLLPSTRWLSLPEEVSVFGDMMNRQLDLRNEAENLLTFETNFAPRNVPVSFPRPLTVFSTADILVEEYEHAVPLETVLRNGGGPFDHQVATVGLDAFLNMLLLDNFVHSDLHPGNIMINVLHPPASDAIVSRLKQLKNSPEEWRKELQRVSDQGYIPEVVFIDAGLVTTLNVTNRKNFLDLFRAVAEFDGYRTGQLMVERCRTPELAIDTETFALKMQHIVLSVKRKTFSLDVLKAVREHHVKMEADFINTVISILLLEGIGRQLDPNLDLFKSALPILRQLGRQMTAQEPMTQLPSGNYGALLKVWMWLEARQLASAAIVDVDDLVKYDLYINIITIHDHDQLGNIFEEFNTYHGV
ncbi:hypothetical protein BU15DRAFT_85462 [Melanogaster broomeanus]|nr:hypothetical protein BU15DRAFT_85462 [Melanogaster broomeanus]